VNVPSTAAGTRLDKFLAEELGSRAAAERAIGAGALVDGVARPKSHRLEGGEVVTLAAEPEVVVTRHTLPQVPLVYEDEHVLVVDKPAGLVVHPVGGEFAELVIDQRQQLLSRLGITLANTLEHLGDITHGRTDLLIRFLERTT